MSRLPPRSPESCSAPILVTTSHNLMPEPWYSPLVMRHPRSKNDETDRCHFSKASAQVVVLALKPRSSHRRTSIPVRGTLTGTTSEGQKDSDAYVLCSSAWNLLANGEKAWRLLSPGASVAEGLLDPMLLERITDRCAYEVHVVQRPGNLKVAPSLWAHSQSQGSL